MLRHLTSITLGAALALAASGAYASNCAPRDLVVERLQDKYSEQMTARGLQEGANRTMVLEIWASSETGTFTVLMTSAQGISCVMAAGTHWFPEPAPRVANLPQGTPS